MENRMPPYANKYRIAFNGYSTYSVYERDTDKFVSSHYSAGEARDLAKALYYASKEDK